jgi:FixJ family two-component response regulator
MTETPATVFVVDDDVSVRRGLERLLRSAGYQVRMFSSARDFLEQDRLDDLGCLVLDLRMPGQSGLDLYEALTATGRDRSVVFITGHGDVPTAVRAMKAGAVDFLPKPVDDGVLLEAVARAMVRERQRRRIDVDRPHHPAT